MSKMTNALSADLDSLANIAASGELGRSLSSFLRRSVEATRRLDRSGEFRTVIDLEDHIDTLTDLITTKVHSR